MFQISKKTEYGLRAMIMLAKNFKSPACRQAGKKFCSVKIISEKENISFDFLEKIISQLEKSKLVKSSKGVNGGYLLAKSPDKIDVRKIVEALEGSGSVCDCTECACRGCAARGVWKKIDASLSKTLENIKLSQLIK